MKDHNWAALIAFVYILLLFLLFDYAMIKIFGNAKTDVSAFQFEKRETVKGRNCGFRGRGINR